MAGFEVITEAGADASTRVLTDIKELRRRARQHIENGAVTDDYRGNRAVLVELLNQALATEIVCVLRYKRHYFMASRINSEAVARELLQHANEEQGHADQLAERIAQLGGAPDLDPASLVNRSHAEYVVGNDLMDMIEENLIAERIASDCAHVRILDAGLPHVPPLACMTSHVTGAYIPRSARRRWRMRCSCTT